MKRKTKLTIAIATAALAVFGAMAVYAQNVHAQDVHTQSKDNNNDKYSLISPGGIAFSDFRGYGRKIRGQTGRFPGFQAMQ